MSDCFIMTPETHEMQNIFPKFINDKFGKFCIIIYIVSRNRVMGANRLNITVRRRKEIFSSVLF